MTRALRTWCALAVTLLGAALLLPALPASAASAIHHEGLEFSSDGVTWSAEPPEVLFADGFVEEPGESQSARVLVRNTRAATVHIATALSGAAWSHPLAATAFTLSSSDQFGSGITEAPIGTISQCTPLLPTRSVGAGDVLSIAVTVELDSSARGTGAESASVRFDVLIALGTGPGTGPASACADLTNASTPFGMGAEPGVIAIASLPDALQPGVMHVAGGGSLILPTLSVALGAGLSGLALWGLLCLRRTRTTEEEAP
jgi:hypothetical protein